ncbi:hypothetical protein FOL47_000622 [Perkinsus chesapeaki]|uniref:Uncharacterized protein n=1 Tax=Perkinsus chesapeaki TaxID=330153 RepID=A0A7J6MME9_PERCH|nr:hypothetical protein FOL47_000622 [Perkinsus chesapeaki]
MSLVLLHRSKDVGRAISGATGLMAPLMGTVRQRLDLGSPRKLEELEDKVYTTCFILIQSHQRKLAIDPDVVVNAIFGSLDELFGDDGNEGGSRQASSAQGGLALTETERMAGMNHMLLGLGLPQMSLDDTGSIMRAIDSLLRMREQEYRRRRESEEKLARIQSDNKMLTGKVKRLTDKLEAASNQVKEAEARLRKSEKEFRHRLSGAMQERDDWERTAHQYRGRDRQKEVENRKLAQQYVKLQRQASERLIEKRARLSSAGRGPKIRMSCPSPAIDVGDEGGEEGSVVTPPSMITDPGLRKRSFRSSNESAGQTAEPTYSVSQHSGDGRDRRHSETNRDRAEWYIGEQRRESHSSRGLSPASIQRSFLAEHPPGGAWGMFDPLTSIYPNSTLLDDGGSVLSSAR